MAIDIVIWRQHYCYKGDWLVVVVRDFCRMMEKLAPLELAQDWDNVGLQIGELAKHVETVLVTLSITTGTVQKAIEAGVDLIIAHHPVIFHPLRQIRTDSSGGALLASLLKHDIAVYVSHTNLDQAPVGLNHWLAREVGLQDFKVLVPAEITDAGLGRIGKISPVSLREFAVNLQFTWNHPVRVVGDQGQTIEHVAVVGGSGGDFVQQAKEAGADVLVTGDVSYHDALDATALQLAVVDAGHFATEIIMVPEVANYLRDALGSNVQILQELSGNPFSF